MPQLTKRASECHASDSDQHNDEFSDRLNWEKETPDIRDAHLRNIELVAIGGKQVSGALMAGESQLLAEVQLKLNEGERIYTEAKGRFATFRTRLFLSYIGITVGLIMLLSLMFVVYQLNRKSQLVKQHTNKSRKSSEKKKKKDDKPKVTAKENGPS
jgi:hypothetical protein